MKIILLSIIFLLTISCSKEIKNRSDFEDNVINLILEKPNGKQIEFPEIYDSLAKRIPDQKDEKLLLVEKLKLRGFKIINSGRGNYPPLGPRIVIVTMKKDNCECEVSKIYYSTISENEFKMTESISCK
ncbi:hypothetical protein [Flavobacterium sp. N1719]|uniref:hypothetical protein n=1 Tax=Flavobacterium sp. N1719 TaxID=2885633 RepID=UPI00222348CA|nr:hypothetical protein [Flavobacterium sp. N1719]